MNIAGTALYNITSEQSSYSSLFQNAECCLYLPLYDLQWIPEMLHMRAVSWNHKNCIILQNIYVVFLPTVIADIYNQNCVPEKVSIIFFVAFLFFFILSFVVCNILLPFFLSPFGIVQHFLPSLFCFFLTELLPVRFNPHLLGQWQLWPRWNTCLPSS